MTKSNKKFIFTFGLGTDKQNTCVLIYADNFKEAEYKMRGKYGLKYAFGYSYEEWDKFYDENSYLIREKIVDEIK